MSHGDPYRDRSSGLPGGPNRPVEPGTAHVESRLTGPPGTERGAGAQAVDEVRDRASELADQARDQARELGDQAREQVDEWTDRAGEYASRARDELGTVLERAEDRLDEQTGVISMARNYPLAAAGLAFGVGFLLAGGDDSKRKRRGMVGRAGGQLRKVVVGGVTTLLMQELQELLDEHGGPTGLLQSITGRGSESEPR
jgi:ElaB/YqjD/DUF883 family membrane-anchored ribosome-binding protein